MHLFTFSHSSLASTISGHNRYWVDLSWSSLPISGSCRMFFPFPLNTNFIIKYLLHILIKLLSLLRP
jgi:hypothetical protein